MGFFDMFRSTPSKVTVLPDVIWLTQQAKHAGLARAVSDALSAPEPPDAVLLVGHFPNTAAELRRLLDEGRIAGPVAVVTTDDLRGTAEGMSLEESRIILITVGERHPLRSHDEAIAEFAEGLSCQSRLVYHISLDEPLMEIFAGEWVQSMLKNLGMKEDEAIESPMVARRIKDAQRKMEDRCRSDFPAASAEEWMAKNCSGA